MRVKASISIKGSLRRHPHPFGARLRLRSACGFRWRPWPWFQPIRALVTDPANQVDLFVAMRW